MRAKGFRVHEGKRTLEINFSHSKGFVALSEYRFVFLQRRGLISAHFGQLLVTVLTSYTKVRKVLTFYPMVHPIDSRVSERLMQGVGTF